MVESSLSRSEFTVCKVRGRLMLLFERRFPARQTILVPSNKTYRPSGGPMISNKSKTRRTEPFRFIGWWGGEERRKGGGCFENFGYYDGKRVRSDWAPGLWDPGTGRYRRSSLFTLSGSVHKSDERKCGATF